MPTAPKEATAKVLAYIENMPDWSKKICTNLRSIILSADESLTEEWKWGPHYSAGGMVCGYGAFQKHIKLTFFNGSAMKDPKGLFNHCVDNEFSRSIKITSNDDIDQEILTAYIKESIAVNQMGFKRVVKDKTVEVPEDLVKALAENKAAETYFNDLSYGYKKDYVEGVTTAKQEKTRLERIAKVVSQCAEGKKPNDKYTNK